MYKKIRKFHLLYARNSVCQFFVAQAKHEQHQKVTESRSSLAHRNSAMCNKRSRLKVTYGNELFLFFFFYRPPIYFVGSVVNTKLVLYPKKFHELLM